MTMEGSLLFLLFEVVCFGARAVGVGREVRSFRQQRASRSWPVVDGVLRHADLLPSKTAWDTRGRRGRGPADGPTPGPKPATRYSLSTTIATEAMTTPATGTPSSPNTGGSKSVRRPRR